MKRYLRFVKKVLGLLTFDSASNSPFLTKLKIGTNALKHDVYRFEDIRPKAMRLPDTVNLIKVFAFLNKNGIIILLDLQAYSRFYEKYFRTGRIMEFIGKVSHLAKKPECISLQAKDCSFRMMDDL